MDEILLASRQLIEGSGGSPYEVTLVGIPDKFHTTASSEIHALSSVLFKLSKDPKYSGKTHGGIIFSKPALSVKVLRSQPQNWKAKKVETAKKDLPNLSNLKKPSDPQQYFEF